MSLRLNFNLHIPLFAFSAFLFSACDKGIPVDASTKEVATFELVQNTIFDQNCATSGCHNSGSAGGGLVLENGKSYSNLINVSPSNSIAKGDNLLRIRPARPESSYLFVKVDQRPLKQGYEDPMPKNLLTPLPSNYREFIREWISAGAPAEGVVADSRLLADPIVINDNFVPPLPPSNGIQLHLRPFVIDPLKEREVFAYDRITNSDTVYVTKIDIKMRLNSHHFILYKYTGGDLQVGQMRDLTGTTDEMTRFFFRKFFIGCQTPELSYQLPANVVLPLDPQSGFDLNSHYVNHSQGIITGEVFVNLTTTQKSDSMKIAQAIFDNYVTFLLPKQSRTTLRYSKTYSAPRNLIMLSSHTHKHGESYKVYATRGSLPDTLIYENYSWDHPPTKTFSPPFRFLTGWGYRLESTYNNDTPSDLRFGFTSEDEMCIVIGYYYD